MLRKASSLRHPAILVTLLPEYSGCIDGDGDGDGDTGKEVNSVPPTNRPKDPLMTSIRVLRLDAYIVYIVNRVDPSRHG